MRILAAILFLTMGFCSARMAVAEPAADAGRAAELSRLFRALSAGGEGRAAAVADLLTRDPAAAGAVAVAAKKLNCEQAAAVALGVSRAVTALKATGGDAVKKIYDPFVRACGDCRGAAAGGDEGESATCRAQERQDVATPNRIRPARGEDCFCSAIAGLAAQIYAEGEAGERMGFFPDELTGNGAAAGWGGQPVSNN